MKRLWVVDFRPGSPGVVPEPRFFPDYEAEGIDVVVADQFTAVVVAEYNHLEAVLRPYPYCQNVGQPANGRWVGEGGDEVYIHNAQLLGSEEELWEALGLKPQMFGGESWGDVHRDVVRDQVPTF